MKLILIAAGWLVCASILPEITLIVTMLFMAAVFIVALADLAVRILDAIF